MNVRIALEEITDLQSTGLDILSYLRNLFFVPPVNLIITLGGKDTYKVLFDGDSKFTWLTLDNVEINRPF